MLLPLAMGDRDGRKKDGQQEAGEQAGRKNAGKKDKQREKDVDLLARSLGIEQRYWPRLDEAFARLITSLPADRSSHPDDPREVIYGRETLPVWAGDVRRAAETAFDETAASLDRSARSLKAVAAVRGRFRGSLNKALE